MDLIWGIFPPEIVENIDFPTFILQPTTNIDKKLKASFSDLIYHCNYGGKEISISLLFEHKSTAETKPHIQLLRYILNSYENRIREEKPLIPVIPIIFYHGVGKWKVRKLYDDEKIAKELFIRDENKVLLLLMKHIKNLPVLLPIFSDILKVDKGYIFTPEGRDFYESVMTLAARLEQKGKTEGLEQGLEKKQREIALKLLEAGTEPEFVSKMIGMSLEELKKLK